MISRKILIAGLVGLVLIAGGASTVLESFGTVSGTADVERPLEIVEVHYENYGNDGSGEYVLFEANREIDLDNWNMSAYEDGVNFNNVSKNVKDRFALVNNKSSVIAPQGVVKFEVGTINGYGLADSGEKLIVEYIPGDVIVHETDYSGSECSIDEAYNFSREACDSAELTGDVQ